MTAQFGGCRNHAAFVGVEGLSDMNTRIFTGMGVAALLALGGCVTGNQVWPTGTLAPVDDASGTMRVRVESQPSGALIVVAGRVVGHAPLYVTVPVTRHGFFPDKTTIRARFLAEDQSYGPVSVSAEFGVLDKVPANLYFNPHGFIRTGFGR